MSALLDKIDAELIRILQNNARISIKEIAKQIFLSSPASSARIARLEKAGYIKGYTIREDERLLGYPIKAFISVEADRKGRDEIYEAIRDCPNVVECNFVSGDFCMVLTVFFEDTGRLDDLIGEIQKLGGNTKTQIVFATPIERRGVQAHTIQH